jgi:subtilisin family serine protease
MADDERAPDDSSADGSPGSLDPRTLDRSVVALPLLHRISATAADEAAEPVSIVIDLNLDYPGGRPAAAARVEQMLAEVQQTATPAGAHAPAVAEARPSGQYLVTTLRPRDIQHLVRLDRAGRAATAPPHAIFHIWPDFDVYALLDKSIATVKADAAQAAFTAFGSDITWAVLDTGVDRNHLHFDEHHNLDGPLEHRDFTDEGPADTDLNGHGTHVAGIIAGYGRSTTKRPLRAVRFERDENDQVLQRAVELESISGIAPRCSIVSYKVLNQDGSGKSSSILDALQAVQDVNDNGRRLRIHGVNLSLGYGFDPEWFACGQSPLCVEVDRLVKSGVSVVVAAGNTGYALATDVLQKRAIPAGRPLSINDPGNSDLAITVGSTHRDMPHVYGVSYFSSKGPTGDGRAKPDLVAPGERILSAATGSMLAEARGSSRARIDYVESSGTSMAAPHVSGVVAAFLSIRREFIGQPERVKHILCSTATDLGRTRDFQGHGLVDAMRAIQSM